MCLRLAKPIKGAAPTFVCVPGRITEASGQPCKSLLRPHDASDLGLHPEPPNGTHWNLVCLKCGRLLKKGRRMAGEVSVTGVRRCVFCRREGGLTKEHVFPQWIWREHGAGRVPPKIINEGPSRSIENFWGGVDGPVGQFLTPGNDKPTLHATGMIVRAVCGACNNGWMSDLETEVIPIVRKVVSGRIWRPRSAEVQTLRRWAVKTALMLECAEPEIALATPEVYDAIFRNVEPPGSWYFGMARVTSENAFDLAVCPVVRTSGPAENVIMGGVSEIYMTEYMMMLARLFLIVRYSPHELRPPARLDHDLIKHPRGRPVTLNEAVVGRPVKLRELPLMHSEHLTDLTYWGHSTSPYGGMMLLGCEGDTWVGQLGLAQPEHFEGMLASEGERAAEPALDLK